LRRSGAVGCDGADERIPGPDHALRVGRNLGATGPRPQNPELHHRRHDRSAQSTRRARPPPARRAAQRGDGRGVARGPAANGGLLRHPGGAYRIQGRPGGSWVRRRLRFATVPQLLASADQRFGARTAIVTAEGSESFRELARSTRSAAEALRRRGLKAGDRVLIAAPNSRSLVHAWLGAIWAGGVPAAVNPELTGSEIDYVRDDLQPAVTLLHDEVDALDAQPSESDRPAFTAP